MFTYPPTAEILNWLAKGRLADRQLRAVRLWYLLHQLYGKANWASQLPQPFRYGDMRDRLFASTHGRSETAKLAALTDQCSAACCCQRSLKSLLEASHLSFSSDDWQQAVVNSTSLSHAQVEQLLEQHPFATVHRSIRGDLTYLVELGWLTSERQGRFRSLSSSSWPKLTARSPASPIGLSASQAREVVRSLESIAFVQPSLEVIV